MGRKNIWGARIFGAGEYLGREGIWDERVSWAEESANLLGALSVWRHGHKSLSAFDPTPTLYCSSLTILSAVTFATYSMQLRRPLSSRSPAGALFPRNSWWAGSRPGTDPSGALKSSFFEVSSRCLITANILAGQAQNSAGCSSEVLFLSSF